MFNKIDCSLPMKSKIERSAISYSATLLTPLLFLLYFQLPSERSICVILSVGIQQTAEIEIKTDYQIPVQ
jgi:hypothetical protein